jgi:uncharacterized protein (DUF983 family)
LRKHVCILGWLYSVLCGLALALGWALCGALWLDPSSSSQNALQFVGPLLLFFAITALVPGLVGGIGLLYSRPWAKSVLWVPSIILLSLVPVGTAIGVYALWVLLNKETHSLLTETEPMKHKTPFSVPPQLALLFVMACVAAGFFLVIKIGFLLHHDPLPSPFDSSALTGLAFLILAPGVTIGTLSLLRSVSETITAVRIQRDANASASMHRQARQLRVEELAADPARAKYAPLVERGEDWSEENIAYYENPEMTISCSHLQSIEEAMRRSGIDVRRYRKRDVSAKCRIDFPALQRLFPISTPVRYAEVYEAERYEYDHPTAFLICEEHQCLIHVVHPDESGAEQSPLFPSVDSGGSLPL